MSDTKELTWGDASRSGDDASDADATEYGSENSAEGWDAYRTWLSKAPAPARRLRPTFDASVYTWKGYRNWSDKVKRSWSDRKDKD